jgi:hypothetical protein
VDVNVDNSDTTTLTAGNGDVSVTSYHGNVDVENSTITAGDSVGLTASGSVTVASGSIGANNNVNVTAGTGITINGTAITADDTTYGDIALTSTTGQTTIQNGASLTAYSLTINSPDGILIDGTSGGSISGNALNLTAGNNDDGNGGPTIQVQGEDLQSFATVNIAAHTVNLFNVIFGGGSVVNVGSFYGVANINNTIKTIIPGDVNFYQSYQGSTLIAGTTTGISTTPGIVGTGIGTTAGINVHAN